MNVVQTEPGKGIRMGTGPSRPPGGSKGSMPESRTEAVCSPFAQLHGSCRAERPHSGDLRFVSRNARYSPAAPGTRGDSIFGDCCAGKAEPLPETLPGAEAWRRICRRGGPGRGAGLRRSAFFRGGPSALRPGHASGPGGMLPLRA